MAGRAVTLSNQLYNIVILAGGNGIRMGEQSNHIPKALSKIGNKRAIDYIIQRYINVAHKFVIGTGIHGDLLESYVKGSYPNELFSFSNEASITNNAIFTMYCLDHCDSRYPTIICFCDLLLVGNIIIKPNTLYYTSSHTGGKMGTFRHTPIITDGLVLAIEKQDPPGKYGVIGCFVINDTIKLKAITYSSTLNDLTDDIISKYNDLNPLRAEEVQAIYEFGNEDDLNAVRKLWVDV